MVVEGVYNLPLFLSPTWLPHGQRWATVKVAVSLTQCLILNRPKGHQERRN